MTSEVRFREATLADALAFYGEWPRVRFRGFAAFDDTGVLGLFGIYWHGTLPVAFSDIRADARRHRKAIVKACRIMRELCLALGQPVYALADQRYPGSTYLLVKLGFKPTGQMTPDGEYLRLEH